MITYKKEILKKDYSTLLNDLKHDLKDFIDFKKPIFENEAEKHLLIKLERTNIFNDTLLIYNKAVENEYRNKTYKQQDFLEDILEYFKRKYFMKENAYEKEIIFNVYLKDNFNRNELESNEKLVLDFFRHRFLTRNLNAYLMQDILKCALLEVSKTAKYSDFELIESQNLDNGFGIDFVCKAMYKKVKVQTYIHVTKSSSFSKRNVENKMSKTWIYKLDKNNNKVTFERFFGNDCLILEYLSDYTELTNEVIKINNIQNLPSNPEILVQDYLDIFEDVKKLNRQDNENERNNYNSCFKHTILKTLEKLDEEILVTTVN